jgi:hypothetical protein
MVENGAFLVLQKADGACKALHVVHEKGPAIAYMEFCPTLPHPGTRKQALCPLMSGA